MYSTLIWSVGVLAIASCFCWIAGIYVRHGYGYSTEGEEE